MTSPDLHDLYGTSFEERYEHTKQMARNGELKLHKTLKAQNLWRKMLGMIFETGHPWMTFKDPVQPALTSAALRVSCTRLTCAPKSRSTPTQKRSPCATWARSTCRSTSRTANLISTNCASTVRTAIRMLDNVIDINYYSVPQRSNPISAIVRSVWPDGLPGRAVQNRCALRI
jgi:ribonucleoside-diphosphate reductase alpha chain